MISMVVCSLLNRPNKVDLITDCVRSFSGYDELIVFTVMPESLGYCTAWNTAAKLAKGDFVVFVSDDHKLLAGSLRDMAIEGVVTSPSGANVGGGQFWGGMFCIPKDILDKYGLYDLAYDGGIHYMDEDLWRRYESNNVPMRRLGDVVVSHTDPGYTLNCVPNFNEKTSKNHNIYNERWQNGNNPS